MRALEARVGGGWGREACPVPASSIGRSRFPHDGGTKSFQRPPGRLIIPGPAEAGTHAHLDRILRSVKLPTPGGRSDRRDPGFVPRGRVRADRIEGRSFRDPRRRTAGVLQARDQALSRLPGDPEAARRLIPAPAGALDQVENANARSARTSAKISTDVAAGTDLRASDEEGGCIVLSQTPWNVQGGW